jgi:hypothetical protein
MNDKIMCLCGTDTRLNGRPRYYAEGCQRKTMRLELREFVRRFCLHLLPERFVKIRHFGLLGNRQRQCRVAQARALLTQAIPAESTGTASEPTRVCPHCGSSRLLLVEIVPRLTVLLPKALDSS